MKIKKLNQIVISEILLVIVLISFNSKLILAFISILIHEISHMIVAQCKGSKFANFRLNVSGAKVEVIDLEELNNKDKFLIYIAGIMANLTIAIISHIIYVHTNIEIFKLLVSTNFGLAVFNLLPAYPLDGARILETIFTRKMSHKKTQEIIIKISYFIAGIFLLLPIIIYIKYKIFNFSMILMSIIIIYMSKQEKKVSMYILMGNIFKKRNNLIKNKFVENRSISVYYNQGLVSLMTFMDKNKFNIFYILDDDLKILAILNEDEVIQSLKDYGNITLVEYINKKSN